MSLISRGRATFILVALSGYVAAVWGLTTGGADILDNNGNKLYFQGASEFIPAGAQCSHMYAWHIHFSIP